MPVGRRKTRARRFVGLVDYLDTRLGSHSGNGPEYQYWCPFCIDREGSESDGRKLWVNFDKGAMHCFRCDYGRRDWLQFFRDLNGGSLRHEEIELCRGEITPPRTHEDMASAVFNILYGAEPEAQELVPVALPPDMQPLAPHARLKTKPIHLRRAFKYLTGRGVTSKQIVQHDLGFCVSGRYAQRVIFPVRQNGRQVYFTNRYCGTHLLKSLNPEKTEGAYSRDHCLLNYDNVVGKAQIAVTEGPFDMMAYDHAVALMGKTISATQVDLLTALVAHGLEEVIVSLDAEAGKDAERVYHRLTRRIPSVVILSLDHGDPDERRDDLADLIDQARPPTVADQVRNRLKKGK